MARDFKDLTNWYCGDGLAGISKDGIGSIAQYFQVLEHWCGQETSTWLFRGERMAYPTPMSPSITRIPDQPTYTKSKSISDQELSEIDRARNDPGRIKVDPLVAGGLANDNPLWIPLAQHYGFKTRLLDVSLDPLGALYFACAPADNQPGYVYVMFSGSLRQHVGLGGTGNEDYSILAAHKHIRTDAGATSETVFDLPPELLNVDVHLLLAPRLRNWRELSQRGLFIWWRDPWKDSTFQVMPIRVRADAKADILHSLSIMGVNDRTLALHRP